MEKDPWRKPIDPWGGYAGTSKDKGTRFSGISKDEDIKSRRAADEKEDIPIEVYAELSRKDLNAIYAGEVEFSLPPGVELNHRDGSRSLYMTCENKKTAKILTLALDDSRIPWTELTDGLKNE